MIRLPDFKFLAVLMLMMDFARPVVAQECSTGYAGLWSQSEVDHFQANYGPCDRLLGLTIEGDDITNLDGLSSLKEISSSLQIQNNGALTDISGLASLVRVGRNLWIENNDALTSLDALPALTSVGNVLAIIYNDRLETLDGFTSLVSTGGTLGIRNNPSLASIDGLTSLKSVGADENSDQAWLQISENPVLTSLDGLSKVASIGNLRSLGGVIITDNVSLGRCQALAQVIDPLDDAEPGPGGGSAPDVMGEIIISGNLPACNSVAHILADSPLVTINAGLNDAWFDPRTDGQGFLIMVFPEIRQVFLAWFTYDTERPPPDVTALLGEPGHRWLTAQGPFEDNAARLSLHITQGGVFDSSMPVPSTTRDGEILLEISSCNAVTLSYEIPSVKLRGVMPLERISLDNVSLCYLLGRGAMAE